MRLNLSSDQVGFIVRGKLNEEHSPGLMEQHADCILSSGEPIGYFGGEGAASSGSSSGSWNRSGLNMKGFVADYQKMRQVRPFYVDLSLAKRYSVISTVLILDVGYGKAVLFDKFWNDLKRNPGAFYLVGRNCSSTSSRAFVAASILNRGIPGLDTPNNLYRQLRSQLQSKATSYSGYIGFIKNNSSNKFDIEIEETDQ